MQLQEQKMMQDREREYNQALDQCMDQDRLQVMRHYCCQYPLHGFMLLLLHKHHNRGCTKIWDVLITAARTSLQGQCQSCGYIAAAKA